MKHSNLNSMEDAISRLLSFYISYVNKLTCIALYPFYFYCSSFKHGNLVIGLHLFYFFKLALTNCTTFRILYFRDECVYLQ